MKNIRLLLHLLIFTSIASFAQPKTNLKDTSSKKAPVPKDRNVSGRGLTRGLKMNGDGLADGYILFTVPNSASVYLINRRGDVVHQWKSNYGVFNAYLQDDGSLMQSAVDPDFPVFMGGGQAGRIQKMSWDNDLLWDFEYANEQHLHHHDFTVMPNGHVLAIAWEAKTADEAIAAGRNPKITPKGGIWPDKIVEIAPQGKMHGKVVWEWHSFDHLIQDFDKTKKNYGNIADHPELINFNAGEDSLPKMSMSLDSFNILKRQGRMGRNADPDKRGADIYHLNAIKYNPDLDQIVFSSPELNEIFIIDHSTTTKEAAGHKGGRWGKGGDILYRWGNSKNYGRGDSLDQQLHYQHDIRWISKGEAGAGHLTIFNNNIPKWDKMNYSAIYEIAPPTDKKGNYLIEKGKAFGPEKPVWTYIATDTVSFWSGHISGAHRMNNGNTFINEGARGRFFEVTKEGKIVWEYLNPYGGDIRIPNGDPFSFSRWFGTFRATFIPADHPGLKGRKLEPIYPQPAVYVSPPQSNMN
ncbi:MAG: aryl-sulfate sulfotransferase [Chitinophagaceae bacterium]